MQRQFNESNTVLKPQRSIDDKFDRDWRQNSTKKKQTANS